MEPNAWSKGTNIESTTIILSIFGSDSIGIDSYHFDQGSMRNTMTRIQRRVTLLGHLIGFVPGELAPRPSLLNFHFAPRHSSRSFVRVDDVDNYHQKVSKRLISATKITYRPALDSLRLQGSHRYLVALLDHYNSFRLLNPHK